MPGMRGSVPRATRIRYGGALEDGTAFVEPGPSCLRGRFGEIKMQIEGNRLGTSRGRAEEE